MTNNITISQLILSASSLFKFVNLIDVSSHSIYFSKFTITGCTFKKSTILYISDLITNASSISELHCLRNTFYESTIIRQIPNLD